MEELFNLLNPWWENKFELNSILREKYMNKIKNYIDSDLVIFLTGLRRIGKTTLLKQTIKYLIDEKSVDPKKILFLNLDHIEFSNSLIKDLLGKFRRINKLSYDDFVYVFLDEITSISNFEQELKNLYDIGNIKFFCSSSVASLMNDKKAYLTGRTITLEVMPLDFEEFLLFKKVHIKPFDKQLNISYFEEYMQKGGIPKFVLENDIDYLNELVNSILYKDIIAQYNIKDEKIIKELLRLLCQRIGKPTSYNKLGKILNISDNSVKKYITYFEKCYLFYSIERYSKSINENITSPKKFYVADLGIKNIISSNKELGANFENLVFLNLKNENPHYLLENGIEIDFITNNSLIESKYGLDLNKKQKILFEKTKRENKIVIKDYTYFKY